MDAGLLLDEYDEIGILYISAEKMPKLIIPYSTFISLSGNATAVCALFVSERL